VFSSVLGFVAMVSMMAISLCIGFRVSWTKKPACDGSVHASSFDALVAVSIDPRLHYSYFPPPELRLLLHG